ncbi:MAG: hypothetical protein DRN37_06315 [Thermoplasmata archaeon]|nr:MAG: hypothetical protein B6U90_06265 [Thermoplasmatales archaeon ex4484_6]RLF57525.1 MAG: hypothetical protein DRN37_06315 [Thermoplasmata archaeon]
MNEENDVIMERFRKEAQDGRISCAACFRIADEFGMEKSGIASLLTGMGIKIVHCQLGCFP